MKNKEQAKTKNLEKSVIEIIQQMVSYIDKQDEKENKS